MMPFKFCWNHTLSVTSQNVERHYTIGNETKGYDLCSDLTIEDVKALQKMLSQIIHYDSIASNIVAEAQATYSTEHGE